MIGAVEMLPLVTYALSKRDQVAGIVVYRLG